MIANVVVPSWRRALVVVAPAAACAALVVSLVRGARADAPPTLGVGSIVSEFDATTESFNVYRALRAAPPSIGGRAANVVVVDAVADADYVVTGAVEGEVHFYGGDDKRIEHDFKLNLTFWAKGHKVGTNTSTCKGRVGVSPAPPDYRYEALLPCVQAQMGEMKRAFGGS